jgi:hypothetical protein
MSADIFFEPDEEAAADNFINLEADKIKAITESPSSL